mgnify:CR=1 FL=1|jgi:hypothetical protein
MTSGRICKHVRAGASILRAVRDVPVYTNDSGWALVCERVGHVNADYLPINLDKYQSRDQSLAEILSLPTYTVAARTSDDRPWMIETRGLSPEMQN